MDKPKSIKVYVAQMEVIPGRPVLNADMIKAIYYDSVNSGADIAVFPELAVSGYLLGDIFERKSFIAECEKQGETLRDITYGKPTTLIFGNVGIDWNRTGEDGRTLKYNAVFVARDGKFIKNTSRNPYDFLPKTLMPNYREFDDSRHFSDSRRLAYREHMKIEDLLQPFQLPSGVALGIGLCEDFWQGDYDVKPASILDEQGADILINCSCSPYTYGKNNKRNRVFNEVASRTKKPMVYVNCVGLQDNGKTVYTFDGSSSIYDGHGHVVALRQFKQICQVFDVPLDGSDFGVSLELVKDDISTLYSSIRYGCSQFLHRIGATKVVIGASGGIDSAVVAAIFSSIVDPEDLLLVNMPSKHNSDLTRDAAYDLAVNLNCNYLVVPIQDSVDLTRKQFDDLLLTKAPGGDINFELSSFAMENVQARDRSSRVLAACSASFGGVFTCNGNKSEITVGYCTLYGDVAGFMAPIGDLWKGQVYELAQYINELYGREIIPEATIKVVPSAELSDNQDVTKGKGDPLVYWYHDKLFSSWVEKWDRATPEDNLQWYLDGTIDEKLGCVYQVKELFPTVEEFVKDLERWWKLYSGMAVAKRIQSPPILATSRRSYGLDLRESQTGTWFSEEYLDIKRELGLD